MSPVVCPHFWSGGVGTRSFPPTFSLNYLVVAGGGGSGEYGGGGGGGMLQGVVTASGSSPLTITVGAGGTAGSTGVTGGSGGDSYLTGLTSLEGYDPGNKGVDITLSNSNLTTSVSTGPAWNSVATFNKVTIGKVYWEVTITQDVDNNYQIGVCNPSAAVNSTYLESTGFCYSPAFGGNSYSLGTKTNGSTSLGGCTTGDVIGVALDVVGNTITFYKNGTEFIIGILPLGFVGPYLAAISIQDVGNILTTNFGATTFAYSPPAGYSSWNSLIQSIHSIGGGGGAYNGNGLPGGSGGGGGGAEYFYTSGSAIPGQGNIGGGGGSHTGSGGGAGGPGGGDWSTGTYGGAGESSTITGSTVWYAGGGGAGGWSSYSPYTGFSVYPLGAGGIGGGGDGGYYGSGTGSGTAGTNGLGGGAGGPAANTTINGAVGGSGVVIISYPTSYGLAANTTGSPVQTTDGSGNYVYTWTTNGSIHFI